MRPNGVIALTNLYTASLPAAAFSRWIIGVSTHPGHSALTRTGVSARASAIIRVIWTSAPLVVV